MIYLLDTNVVSELRKLDAGRCEPTVAEWAAGVGAKEQWLSAVSIRELQSGALRAGRRDLVQGRRLARWVDEVQRRFVQRILPVDAAVARQAAALHVPDPAPESDAYIGACALVHSLVVVTRNTADFERFSGLRLLNPWLDR